MIQNTSLTIILAIFILFLWMLREYLINNFKTEENKSMMKQVDLLLILPTFISIIFYSVILTQHDIDTQNKMLIAWVEVVVLLVSPFVFIIFTSFIKSIIENFVNKNKKNEHDSGEHND